MAITRLTKKNHQLAALILAKRSVGESDLILELLTDELGHVSAVARSGRSSRKRFGGTLEPFHTLSVSLDRSPNRDLASLREAGLSRLRSRLASDFNAMQAAGQALRWIRGAKAPGAADPALWALAERWLDAFEAEADQPRRIQGEYGLELLAVLGWGLDFEACVGCGKPCAPRKPAFINALRGGLVCRSCGAGGQLLSGEQRVRLRDAAAGNHPSLEPIDARIAIDLVTQVLQAHGTS